MTTRVQLRKVTVLDQASAQFDNPIKIRLLLQIFEKIPSKTFDVKFIWSPIWDFDVDQLLDELEVGPFTTLGMQQIVLQCDPPDVRLIPDPTGPTALIVKIFYNGQQFLHLGFNVIVTCDASIPDTFASSQMLKREIGKCISRTKSIK